MTVLLPAYNEADNLAELFRRVAAVLERAGVTYEIVVVDDGSTDGTRELMQRAARAPRSAHIRLRRNAGQVGRARRRAWRTCGASTSC